MQIFQSFEGSAFKNVAFSKNVILTIMYFLFMGIQLCFLHNTALHTRGLVWYVPYCDPCRRYLDSLRVPEKLLVITDQE